MLAHTAPAMPQPHAHPPLKQPGILILGLGNILLTDEGAGVHAVNRLAHEQADRDDLRCVDGGTLSFTLAGLVASTDALIVVDTAALHTAPGSVRVFEGTAMDEFIRTGGRASVHEVSLSDLLTISALEGLLPSRRALVGIQPQDFDWGEFPSPEVAAGLPVACAEIMKLVERWQA